MSFRLGTVVVRSAAMVCLGSLSVPHANAQVGAFSSYMSSGTDQFSYVLNSIQMQSIFNNAEERASKKPDRPQAVVAGKVPPASTVVILGSSVLGPRLMARAYPADRRAAAEATFTQLLSGYGKIEGRFGIRHGDMAGAMAALIAGSLSACRDEDIPDAGFLQTVSQLRRAIGTDTAFARIGIAEKQEAYEQFAILGTMLALTRMGLKENPDAAGEQRMRTAGCSCLKQFSIDPDSVALTEKGLVAR